MASNQLVVVAVEYAGITDSVNKLSKIRIHRSDVLRFELCANTKEIGEDVNGNPSLNRVFSEHAVRRVILERIEVDGGKDRDRTENNDEGTRTIQKAKVEFYDPNSCKFMVITDDSWKPVVDRFGTRVRCIVSDIVWSSSSVEKDSLGLIKQDNTPLLTIMGRYFPYNQENGMNFAGKKLNVKEIPNSQIDGTGLNIWDGAMLLAKYLEIFPGKVRSKSVLELGSGCGLVGIAAGLLGAKEVTMTDLEYSLPLMRENVEHNMKQIQKSRCGIITCAVCDWFNPPSVNSFNFCTKGMFPDVVLVADCVWLEELVDPLLTTLDKFSDLGTHVIVSYQRRGKNTHNKFWRGLHKTFERVVDVDVSGESKRGLKKPSTLFLLECTKKDKDFK